MHEALQAHYQGGDPLAALSDYWAPVLQDMGPEDPNRFQLEKDVELSGIMVDGYLDWVAEEGVDAGLTVVACEEEVTWETDEFVLHGTIDLVLSDPDGNLFLMDHKTTASFAALVDRRLTLNFQLLTYAVLCEEFFGVHPAGAELNMLRKVKRTANAKPPFYQRESVHFNQHQLAAHRQHIQAIVRDMENPSIYPVVDQDCSWKCPFLPVCAMADDGSDYEGALNDLYVRRDERYA